MQEEKELVKLIKKEFGNKKIRDYELQNWFLKLNTFTTITNNYLFSIALGAGMNIKFLKGRHVKAFKITEKRIDDYTKEELESLLARYKKYELCKMLRCGCEKLKVACINNGIDYKERDNKQAFDIPKREELMENYVKCGTITAMANYYDISTATVSRWFYEKNITKKDKDKEIKIRTMLMENESEVQA